MCGLQSTKSHLSVQNEVSERECKEEELYSAVQSVTVTKVQNDKHRALRSTTSD